MQFAYTILYVDDVTRTIAFYERAFALQRRMIHESGDYAELETGATVLAFASLAFIASTGKPVAAVDPARTSFEIAFTTDDVPATVERALAAGATPVQAATEMPWGQTVAYVRDDSGALVELCTPMEAPSP